MSVCEWQLDDLAFRSLQVHLVNGALQQVGDAESFPGGFAKRIITDGPPHAHGERFGMDRQRVKREDFFRALVEEFAETRKSFFEGRHVEVRIKGQGGIFREDQETFALREQVHAEAERFEQTFGRVVDGDASDGAQKRDEGRGHARGGATSLHRSFQSVV